MLIFIKRELLSFSMLEEVQRFVDDAFRRRDSNKIFKHFERTVFWTKQLKPDADEAILIAAYAHDIGRAVSNESLDFYKDKELNDADYLEEHQKDSARIITKFLEKEGYDKEAISRISNMV